MARKNIKVKLGKKQSEIGFFAGIAFVILGVVVAIPTFGLFGIIWTCLAGFICYSYYKNAYTDEGMPAYEISIDEDVSQIEERLKKLDHLYNNGLITRDEYDEKRKEILNQI
jgi:hypothetical protein